MGQKQIIQQLKAFKEKVTKDFPVDSMILFGSLAKGRTHQDSDIDLIIVSRKFRQLNFIKRSSKMYNYWTMDCPS